MIKVTFTGFKELSERLKKAPDNIRTRVDADFQDAADEIRSLAIRDAPADQGILREEITVSKQELMTYEVVSGAIYSGFQEFGTKSKVSVPAGLEDVAASLKGSVTSSLSAKEAIYAWCKRKGIEKNLWWPIFIKVITTGIHPHPFFFKQMEVVRPKLISRVQKSLEI